jgi:hypothetical protein
LRAKGGRKKEIKISKIKSDEEYQEGIAKSTDTFTFGDLSSTMKERERRRTISPLGIFTNMLQMKESIKHSPTINLNPSKIGGQTFLN